MTGQSRPQEHEMPEVVTFGLDEIDGGEEFYELTPKNIGESSQWGTPVRYWRQFFDYVAMEVRSDHNHLAIQVTGPDPKVCKRLCRAYFDAATAIDAVISEEASKRLKFK